MGDVGDAADDAVRADNQRIADEGGQHDAVGARVKREDHDPVGIAEVVGVTTHGKGCMQTTFPLNSGFSGAVKLTTHMYYSGGDEKLVGYDQVGIDPDVKVALGEEQTKVNIHIVPQSEDAQLLAAVELFK